MSTALTPCRRDRTRCATDAAPKTWVGTHGVRRVPIAPCCGQLLHSHKHPAVLPVYRIQAPALTIQHHLVQPGALPHAARPRQDTSHLVKEGGDALVLAHDLQPLARDVACPRCRGAPTFTIYNYARSRRRGKHSCALSGHSALQTYPVLGMQCKGHPWMDLLSFRSSGWCPGTCSPSIRACQMKKRCAPPAWRVPRQLLHAVLGAAA